MSPNLRSCWGSFGTQSVSEGLLDFRGAGVGLGDKPAVCGDCPRSLVFPEGVLAPLVRPSTMRSKQVGQVILCNGVGRSWSSWVNPSCSMVMSSIL